MFEKISLKAMCAYEKETGNNAMALFAKETKSATDFRDMAYLVKKTSEPTTTLQSIEDISTEDFNKLITSIT